MTSRIGVVPAELIDDLAILLKQINHPVTALSDMTSLNAWLAKHGTVTLIPEPSSRKPNTQTTTNRNKLSSSIWRLDPVSFTLISPDGKSVYLSHKEYIVLQASSVANKKLICRKTLINALGEDVNHYDERRLESMISRLRAKLTTQNLDGSLIRAIKGQGYLFGMQIRELTRDDSY